MNPAGDSPTTRAPLSAEPSGATTLEAIVTHLKSNFINQDQQPWTDPGSHTDFVKAALKHRGPLATESMRVRIYLGTRLRILRVVGRV